MNATFKGGFEFVKILIYASHYQQSMRVFEHKSIYAPVNSRRLCFGMILIGCIINSASQTGH